MPGLDPLIIVVKDRQRKIQDSIDDEFVKSVSRRLIHPIVLRRVEGENPALVVGGRRLAALIKSGLTELVEGFHFRYMDDLSPTEAQIVELEENIKRVDLPWRDHVEAIGRIHDLYTKTNKKWSLEKTSSELNLSHAQVNNIITVYKNLNSPLLKDAQSIVQSYSILQTAADRRAASIVSDIINVGAQIFNPPINPLNDVAPNGSIIQSPVIEPEGPEDKPNPIDEIKAPAQPPTQVGPIICADFLDWIKDYSGPKFNLIHCDFPYDIEYLKYAKSITGTAEDYDFKGYKALLDALCSNLDKIASYSLHIMFWFSMTFYQETKTKLQEAGLYVHDHPLVWLKSDNVGIIPGQNNQFPRRIYETALLCSRGKRPLIRSLSNAYAAPTSTNALHPSQKPEPVLKHFLSMLIDETTDVFDPTAGSGTALRAAEDLGARSTLGLEISQQYAEMANSVTQLSRQLRKAAQR